MNPSYSPTLPREINSAADQFASRRKSFVIFLAVLVAIFALPLFWLAVHAAGSNLHSHVLLIPFISLYLIHLERNKLPATYVPALGTAIAFGSIGAATFVLAWALHLGNYSISYNDSLAVFAFSFISLIVAGASFFLGGQWMKAAAFPMAFLIFMIPMPDALADFLEEASKQASAEVANSLFVLTGTAVLRDGPVFQLPGITIEVAKECSGIRSSYVLLMTSLLASYLFLRSPWRRVLLVVAVIPLGLMRNGFRILTIALLCVHIGPHMINSVIHRRGGPVFFVASLVPLFALLWWLRRREVKRQSKASNELVMAR